MMIIFYLKFLAYPLLLFLIICLVKKLFEDVMLLYYAHQVPGPEKINLFFGNVKREDISSHERIFCLQRECMKKYYPVYKLWLFNKVSVNLVKPQDFETIMSDPNHNRKGEVYKFLDFWLRKGLLTSHGDHWQQRRKILTPAFHFGILQDFIKIFNEQTDWLVEMIEEKLSDCDETVFDVVPLMTQFMLKTLAETSMGTKLDFKDEKDLEYKNAMHEVVAIFFRRVFNPWMFYLITYVFTPTFYREQKMVKILHEFSGKVIRRREIDSKNIPDFGKTKRRAMLDLLLAAKDQGKIDDRGIREEVDTFIFAGHDTTTTAISFALMLIASHPDVQEELLKEMREVFSDDIKKKPTFKELQELKYMERCLKEALRMYPIAYYVSRIAGKDLTLSTGHKVKKGTLVQLHIYDLHRDPSIYPNPEKYDPDRFLPENCQKRHPYAYVPFSAGPRNCIGQKYALWEMKVMLCGILSNFVLEPVDTPETIEMSITLVLRAKHGLKVKFSRRNN